MSLECTVSIDGRLEAHLSAAPGEVLGVIGPNGSGKTTLLRCIAGTAEPCSVVRVSGADWTGRPPQGRSVGFVFQEHLLFPHLSARDNVAFGPRSRGASRRRARVVAEEWLARLGVAEYAGRRSHELSGGQAQRVAIARALATDPEVLLLDEPFAALDVAVAIELRELLAAHLQGYPGTVLIASHESLDVLALADRVVVLEQGRVAQLADLTTVAEAPATAHAARLVGLNLLRGTATGDGGIMLAEGGLLTSSSDVDGPVLATFPPSAVTITRDQPTGSARNAWPLRVRTVAGRGSTTRLHLQGAHDLRADVTGSAAAQLGLSPGADVWASVKATEVTVFPAVSEASRTAAGG